MPSSPSPPQLGAARKPGRTSIASLLLVLTEATEFVSRLDAERAKAQRPGSEDVDLAFKCHTALVHCVVAMYTLWLLLPGQLPTPSEPSVQVGACECL
jgi:hypothetical protein